MNVVITYTVALPGNTTLDMLDSLLEDLRGIGSANFVTEPTGSKHISGEVIVDNEDNPHLSNVLFTDFSEEFKLGYETCEREEEINGLIRPHGLQPKDLRITLKGDS
jgi:hypothetical protein